MTGYNSKKAMAYDKLADGDLYDEVINQIAMDISNSDFTAIEELLRFVPREKLIGYLPEEGL
jgi:dihydroneopterin aldolase